MAKRRKKENEEIRGIDRPGRNVPQGAEDAGRPEAGRPDAEPPDTREQAEATGAPQSAIDTTAAAPDRDRIAMRAYELYESRGGRDGEALDDWLTAERELDQSHRSRSSE